MRVGVSYIDTVEPFSERIDATGRGGGRGDEEGPEMHVF